MLKYAFFVNFLRYLARYLPACNFRLNSLNFFLHTGVIFANFSDAGKLQTSIMLLKLWYMKFENMSEFSLIFLVGILSPCDAFGASKCFISWTISSFVIRLKVNTGPFLVFLFIAKIQGCLRYFNIAFKAGFLTLLSQYGFLRDI